MGSWTTLLLTYLLGGITFVPFVVLVMLAHAHYTLPYRHDLMPPRDGDHDRPQNDIVQPGDDTAALEAEQKKPLAGAVNTRATRDLDVAAGYFAVCREYTPMGLNAKPIERSTPVGSTTVASPSPSVYQTMYRSIFDRRPATGPLDSNNINNSMSQRPKKAGNVFYVVLRHGHIMLFDDEEQLEVRHVISLANYDISIYSGGDVTPEGELFIKRNALCLSRRQVGQEKPDADGQVLKPFYLFSENCSAKEDFYFALLRNQVQTFGFDSNPPIPKGFEVKNIISLVQRLHSSEDHVHSRWLNAMLGRIFLAVYRTRDLEDLIREKITKKISRVKRPSFLANITIQKIDTGEAAPYFTNLKLKDLTVEGECVVEADVRYTGNFRLEVGATAKIDLGARFKAREVNLLLAVVLKRIEGHVLFKVKAPPSNRVWMSFQTMPKMETAIEPIVSSRQITYTLILRQIESRIKEVFAETLVQPFWDDVPFLRTEHKVWRGGIFQGDDAVTPSEAAERPPAVSNVEQPERPHDHEDLVHQTRPPEKSHTLPATGQQPTNTGFFGRKLGKGANGSATSVLTSGTDSKAPVPSGHSTPRSLNIMKNSTDPVVGTETAHADLFKPSSSPPDHATNLMASLASRSQDASPMPMAPEASVKSSPRAKRLSRSSMSSKEIDNRESNGDADTTPVQTARPKKASIESLPHSEESRPGSPKPSETGSFKSNAEPLGRNFFARRDTSSTTASNESSSGGSLKRNTLAAVTNAAEQARQWGWNAIRRQKDQRQNGDKSHQVDLSQPMGRGQPLPPPGTPLPGPTNGATRLVAAPAPKRKPVPMREQPQVESADYDKEAPSPQPPLLPQRRRRGASQQQEEDVEQNMLVVAAPDDSQPGTPSYEDQVDYDAARADSAAAKLEEAAGTIDFSVADADVASASTKSSSSSLQGCSREPAVSAARVEKESPLAAIPAAAVGLDDEDLSGWLEDTFEDDSGASLTTIDETK
ncbi:uncharacterized protein MAM_01732 [Metarhizium album ARSEF 1941]|uniref:SMP-LTD domain-containing protein n=1 Tax=Metarhizium album (strain ARSEF 1941) TaxID=1081103 RepID=A0A0B2X3N0_METAS|nr:uncharacterized protein MAM_01732 [Metarhizium album ARSEF 1941]KHO00954.1 hypothetical protein MAM_01732 [Metarhizium album ARSEF 1941]